ncbi:MAG: carboxypeptidase-like regulatory domain-containing protein [Nitrospiraceae bacterium]|nr:carboxypeptidase-like regulatory domain-containing protein [Nitrospiraceae bacterium]
MKLALALAAALLASGVVFAAQAGTAAAQGALSAAQGAAGLEGVVTGPSGSPVEGAYVYVYTGEFPALGTPPDFVSGRTGADGRFMVYLPKGTYVAFARKKADGERFGPLDKDDFASTERPVVDIAGGMVKRDFRLYGLREAFSMLNPELKRLVVIKGIIREAGGRPAVGLCAVAFKGAAAGGGMPDYISSPSDEKGRYEIYVPAGSKVALGAAEVGPGGFRIMGWRGDVSAAGEDLRGVGIVLSKKNEPVMEEK